MVNNSIVHHSDITDVLYLLISVSHHLQLANDLKNEYQRVGNKQALKDYKHAILLTYRLNHRLQAHKEALKEFTNIVDRSLTDKQVIVLDSLTTNYSDVVRHKGTARNLRTMQDILNYRPVRNMYKQSRKKQTT